MWNMDPMTGFDIRLVFTLPPRDRTLQYKRCVHFWNNFSCLTILVCGHVMSHKKFGPDRFSHFDVYWIQTNRHPPKHPDKPNFYIDSLKKILKETEVFSTNANFLSSISLQPDFKINLFHFTRHSKIYNLK